MSSQNEATLSDGYSIKSNLNNCQTMLALESKLIVTQRHMHSQ